jgi:hypothetical protein
MAMLEPQNNPMTAPALKQEFEYYIAHQDELVAKHLGKFVVIKGQEVIGTYDDELHAIRETQRQHPLGSFLVQKCEPGEESYTQSFHSLVAFM